MFNSRGLLGALLGSGMGGRNPRMGGLGGLLSGGGLGGAPRSGSMLGRMVGGGRTGGSGVQGALLGVLGGIAVNALQRRTQGAPADHTAAGQYSGAPGGAEPRFAPASGRSDPDQAGSERPAMATDGPDAVDEGRASLLVRIMVAAANADLRIDEQERGRILGKIEEAGAGPEAQEFVVREMRSPMTLDQIAREVSGPDVAAQAYAAALAAIDVDKATERHFLAALAERTGLDAEVVNEIHDQLGQPRPGS